MLLRELYFQIKDSFTKNGITSLMEVDVIIEAVFGKVYHKLNPLLELKEDQVIKVYTLVNKRIEGYPIQYIAKRWPFLDFELEVGEGVLIPRPETQDVVEYALKCINGIVSPTILDLCSGTGCIAIAAKRAREDANISAVEKYNEAFEYLLKNVKLLGLDISTIKDSVFGYDKKLEKESLDLIICNPPYVSKDEYSSLAKELYSEPKVALTDNDDGLRFYRYISKEYATKLKSDGFLVFEISGLKPNMVKDTIPNELYKNVLVLEDSFGNDRILTAQKV